MKQDEYSTARPTLKRWNNRSLTVEPGGPDHRQFEHKSPNHLTEPETLLSVRPDQPACN